MSTTRLRSRYLFTLALTLAVWTVYAAALLGGQLASPA